jgi:hypothetical protein
VKCHPSLKNVGSVYEKNEKSKMNSFIFVNCPWNKEMRWGALEWLNK